METKHDYGVGTRTLHTKRSLIYMSVLTLVIVSSLIGGAVALLKPHQVSAAASDQKSSANKVPLGAQAGFEWVDLVKTGPRMIKVADAKTDLTLDVNGWPQADFEYIFADDRRNMPWDGPDFNGVHSDTSGTYHLSFTGQATLSAVEDPAAVTFQNQHYNAATNSTTVDVIAQPNHWLRAISFNKTQRTAKDVVNSGVTNMRMIRPGYPANTTKVFTDEWINALKNSDTSIFRSFDSGAIGYNIFNGTNPVTVKWADRSLPTDSYWSLPVKNEGDKRGLGVPWEYYIQLSNQTHINPWLNIPVSADDDYIINLAKLLKNGNQFTKPLDRERTIYLELSDENWNWGFTESIYTQLQAQKEGIGMLDWEIERTIQISNLFRQVYGVAAINTTIRPVAFWQYNTGLSMQGSLFWAEQKFKAPVKNFLYGIGEAPYVDPLEPSSRDNGIAPYPDPADPKGIDRIIDTYYTAGGQKRIVFTAWQTIATFFGLHQTGYEGGPSGSIGIFPDVARSPRMRDLITRHYVENYYATGADELIFFAFGKGVPNHDGDWYTFEDYAHQDTSKNLGLIDLANKKRPDVAVGSVLPWKVNESVSIDASQFITGSKDLNPLGSAVSICQSGCWPTASYLLRVPSQGTYALQIAGHSDADTTKLQVQVDDAVVSTISLPPNTDGTVPAGTVKLAPGMHTLFLQSVGTGRNTFTPNGGITFTLTAGGGKGIRPSAPLNVQNTVNDKQANLSWENVTTATSYTIKRSTTSGGPYKTVGTSKTTSFSDTTVSNDTRYYYTVTASNSIGESALSPQIEEVPTLPVKPVQPTSVVGEAGASETNPFIPGGQVRISWPSVPNAVTYNIKRSTSKTGPFDKIQNQQNNIYYDQNLTVGTTYYFSISAVNSFGESVDSDIVTLTPTLSVPDAPTKLSAKATKNSVSLKWLPSKWQLPYWTPLFHIKRGPTANGPFSNILDISTSNSIDLGLKSGTTYCYVISSFNSAGESPNSAPVCVTTSK